MAEGSRWRGPVALLVVLAAGAGAFAYGTSRTPAPGDAGGGAELAPAAAQHIHGLGIDPADGSLLIATHGGLFRAATGRERATRVGEGRQDTMGFTVVGPNRFLGSGHPGLGEQLPPLLGLIRSDDAGRSWEPVSLLGEADFHVLRADGRRIYGVNASDGTLLVSGDSGRSWERRTPPGPLADLVPRPGEPDALVAAGAEGLYASRDAGRSWRALAKGPAGLLAWPRPGALYAVDAAGEVRRSADAGRSWERAGAVGGPPAAFASHGDELYVALHDGRVEVSSDGGRSWRPRAAV